MTATIDQLVSSARRCTQCWREKPLDQFRGARKEVVQWCRSCRSLYKDGAGLRESRRVDICSTEIRVRFTPRSGNSKLGPIPSTMTSGETCPDACGLKDAGCYAEFGLLGSFWRSVPDEGLTWGEFLDRVRRLRPHQLWRHNSAGDLPGEGDHLDVDRFLELVEANLGRRGFTMTRKPLRRAIERHAIALAVRKGFVVNVTAHGLHEVDELVERFAGRVPVVVVLPENAPRRMSTPKGRPVVVCPAQTTSHATCASCQLCSRARRLAVVGFRAHGQWKANVSRLVQLRTSH